MKHIKPFLPYLLGIVIALGVLYWIRWGFLCTAGEYEPDCYYHARIAEQGPSVFCAKQFPWLTKSSWADNYSDKEMGFHFLLWAFINVGKWFGMVNDFPFNAHVLFFDAILLLAYNILLYRNRIKHPWIYNLLLITAFGALTYRLLSLRAYLLSMTLATVLITLFMDDRFVKSKWRFAVLGGIGFIASWCYSSPHLLLFTFMPFVVAEFFAERKWWPLFLSPVIFLFGILLGLIIHPQFPNSFLIFKEQCIDVILAFCLKVKDIPVQGGNELYSNVFELIYACHFTYPLLILTIIGLLIYYRKQFFASGWQKNVSFNGMMLLTIGITLVSYVIYRFGEYALVPQCFAIGLLLRKVDEFRAARTSDASQEEAAQAECEASQKTVVDAALPQATKPEPNVQSAAKPSTLVALCREYGFGTIYAFCLVCITSISLYVMVCNTPYLGQAYFPCVPFADWARDVKIPEGTVIANADWSDFPMLYFSMPEYRFLWGLDPAFSWKKAPNVVKIFADLANEHIFEPEDYAKEYGTKYMFVYQKQLMMADIFWEYGFVCLYENVDGWLFDLSQPRVLPPKPLPFLELKKQRLHPNNQTKASSGANSN